MTVGPPATVTLNPDFVSLTAGDVLPMSFTVLDAQGRGVFNQTVTFSSTNPAIQVANNGVVCAGTWDSLTNPIVCNPATPGPAGVAASIRAMAGTVSSPLVSVFVHQPITSIEVTPQNPPCVPQAGTVEFRAVARNGTTDITASVGQINWQVQNGQVASASPLTTGPAASGGGTDPITVTARLPGRTQIIASANNANQAFSLPANFTECPIAQIALSAPNTTLSAPGMTVQFTATATDTTGATVATTGGTTENPAIALTWTSTPSAVATVSATGLVTGQFAGTSGIVAGCAPSTCNINLQPVYSDVTPITISGASATTVYAVAIDGTTLIPINTTNNTAGTAINLPANQNKNSAVFSANGLRLFLGTDGGLLAIDPSNNTLAANITNAQGKVLAVSPDGNQVLVSDLGAGKLRLFNGTANTLTNFNVLNAIAADFNADGSKAYVVAGDSTTTGNKLLLLQGAAVSTFSLANIANDVSFLASANAAYLANSTTSRILTCNNSVANGPGGTPALVRTLPNGKQVLGADDSSIEASDVTTTPAGGSSASACPALSETRVPHATGSTATPAQLLISPDSTKAFITSRDRTGSLLVYEVGANAAAGNPSTIALAGAEAATAATTTGGITPDSTTLYVGGTDNNVHVIDIATGTDTAQIPVSFTPDFVAVRPR